MKVKRRKPAAKKASPKRKSIRQAVADRGPSGRDWLTGAGRLYRPIKKPVTLRLDADVLMWFKGAGRGYQTRINQALRGVMAKEKKGRR